MSSTKGIITGILGIAVLATLAPGCSKKGLGTDEQLSQGGVTDPLLVSGRISLSVYNKSTGQLVYSDSVAGSSLKLVANTAYNFKVTGSNVPAGTSFGFYATNIDVVAGGDLPPVTLQLGDNSYTAPAQGDYTIKVTAAGAPVATRNLQAFVACRTPTFTAASLKGNQLSASSSGNNIYSFDAAGVVSSANGMAPYLCAYDTSGVGIRDTAFTDCGAASPGYYVDLVGARNVGVIVKDACNTTYTVSNPQNLANSVPGKPGNVFIAGQNSGASGTAATDSRINNATYLATNTMGFNYVQPLYSSNSGQGTFVISSFHSYKMLSSMDYGMKIEVSNLTDTLSLSGLSGTVKATHAMISKITFATDQAGDQSPNRTLVGTSCSLTNQDARVLNLQGIPCSAGQTGDQNSADVEVWGDYTCTGVGDAGGATTITGSFDGVAHIADSCVGGGQGGGGIVPIKL